MNDEYKPNTFKSIGTLVRIHKPTKMILYISEDKDTIDLDYYKNIEKEIIKIPMERDNIKMVEYALSENKDDFVLHTGLDEKKSTELYNNLHKILHTQIDMIYHSSKNYNAFLKKMLKTGLETEKIKELYDELDMKSPKAKAKAKTTRKKKTKTVDVPPMDDDEELLHNLYDQLEKKQQDPSFLPPPMDEELLHKLYDELEEKQSTNTTTRKAAKGGRRKHRKSKRMNKRRGRFY
jgi:hypothetical protein